MTRAAIKNAFRKLDATEQADVLKELAATLAETLSEADRVDARVFDRRRQEEPSARPWSQVRATVDARRGLKRPAKR